MPTEDDKCMLSLENAAQAKMYAERLKVAQSEIQANVDPAHYKKHIAGMEWVESEWELAHGDMDKFLFAMLVQMRKYHARLGKKDTNAQELRKSAFYLLYGILAIEHPDIRPSPSHVQKLLHQL